MIATVDGSKAYFAGGTLNGNRVQVYDALSNTWSWFALPANIRNFTMDAVHGKVYFGGGYQDATSSYSPYVVIYDPATATWTGELLSQPRILAAAVVVDDAVGVFAGGLAKGATSTPVVSNRVDLYAVPVLRTDFTTYDQAAPGQMGIAVKPNPCINELQIGLADAVHLPAVVTVYNLQGSKVMEFQSNNPITVIRSGG